MSDPIPVRQIESLSSLLRGVGAAVLLAAASTFLLQHWEAGNDLYRYAGLLVLTAGLSVAGFLCGLRIRDPKSARVFLALAAGLVPAHFCILGGFVYSQFAWGSGPIAVPAYASWVAPSALAAGLVPLGAGLLLLPLAGLSFLALARSRTLPLTVAYALLNLALLIPTRESATIAGVLAAGVVGLALFELRVLRRDLALRTFDGALVQLMLATPLLLIAARSILHYELSFAFAAVIFSAGTLVLLLASRETSFATRRRCALETASLPMGAAASLLVSATLVEAGLPDAGALPAAALPFAGLLLGLSFVGVGPGVHRQRAAAVVALGAAAVNLALFPGIATALLCMGVAIATLAYGFLTGQRVLLAVGVGAAGFAVLQHMRVALDFYALAHWGSLAGIGVAVIVCASLLERHHEVLRERFAAVRAKLEE